MSLRILFLIFVVFNLFVFSAQIDSLNIAKIEKTIQMEEEIAKAYKKYLVDNGTVPTIAQLKTNSKYLPASFSIINPFGKTTDISTSEDYAIISNIPDDIKIGIYEKYYTNELRENTQGPKGTSSNNVKIILNPKEKFIFENKDKITTDDSALTNKYYLEKGALHWYDNTGQYKYTFNENLIVSSDVTMIDSSGNFTSGFDELTSNVRYVGQIILQERTGGVVEDYLSTTTGLIKLDPVDNNVGKTIIQFSRRSGGMIVNGDLYTWGNNRYKITGIDSNSFTGAKNSNSYPVINVPVRVKVANDTYFSSPLRTKFKDFFASVYHGVCGVSVEGVLFCSGVGDSYKELESGAIQDGTLYKSTFFDGVTHKAKKVFANDSIWTILSEDGNIYNYGVDNYAGGSGFSGSGNRYFSSTSSVDVLHNSLDGEKFQDITYTLTTGKRKVATLSTIGDIYVWGAEGYSTDSYCNYSANINLCIPSKPEIQDNKEITFTSLSGGLNSFIAKDDKENYYKIYDDNSIMRVQDIKSIIVFDENTDKSIISVDITKDGVVWINENNQLKGDYLPSESDAIFENAIKQIKWKQIKVIDENNGMCGIDIKNQMYCWGVMYYYSSAYYEGNTITMPVFNSNLYDSQKDFLLTEGTVNYITDMTSEKWDSTSNTNTFFMRYPTYIGGFNYEFEFK